MADDQRIDQITLETPSGHPDLEWVSDVLKRGVTGLWRWDVKADRVIWTDNIRQLMGAPSDVGSGREGFLQMIRPEDRAGFEEAISKALETKSEFRYDFQAIGRSGADAIWLEAVGEVMTDEDDVPFAIDGAIYDVSQRVTAQRQLAQTHDSYQKIISAAGLVVYSHDIVHDEYQIANLSVLEKLLGESYEGSHSKFWSSVKTLASSPMGDLAGLTMAEAKREFATGKLSVWRAEYKILRKDGQIRWLYDHSSPIRDSDGNVVGSFGILQDLTELKRLSEAISNIVQRTSEGGSYLKQLALALSEALEVKAAYIAEVDGQDSTTAKSAVFAVDAQVCEAPSIDLAETPYREICETNLVFYRSDVRDAFPNDPLLAKIDANAYLGICMRSVEGEVIGLVTVVHDKKIDETLGPVNVLRLFAAHAAAEIERQRAERKLKVSENLYRSMIGVQTEGIVIYDQDNQILACNASAQKILNASEGELVGRRPAQLVSRIENLDGTPLDPATVPSYLAITTGQPQTNRVYGLTFKDGTTTWVSVNAMPIENADGQGNRHAVVSFADITARLKAEKELRELNSSLEALVDQRTHDLRRANRELESFAYSVSHDLRQPLRSIDGFSRILEMDYGSRLDAEGLGHIKTIRAATRRMSNLIDDLLRLSRLISHEVKLQEVDITRLTQDIFGTLHAEISERQYEFIVQPNLKTWGDESLMRAVLDNLIQNAWKFSAHEEKTVIEVGSHDGVFFVRDNGVGFDMKYSNKLFEPFQRLHTQNEFEGTGIGLATVRRIVESHKGNVWAESELGKGTTVYFTVALK